MTPDKGVLERSRITPYFDYWSKNYPIIKKGYDSKDTATRTLMEDAINNYEKLLDSCTALLDPLQRTSVQPLNGEERLQFVKDKIASPFALVQLNALYTELRKKISRFLVN